METSTCHCGAEKLAGVAFCGRCRSALPVAYLRDVMRAQAGTREYEHAYSEACKFLKGKQAR